MTTTPIRVAVIEDHPMFRQGLVALLNTLPGLDVVGDAGDAEHGEALVASTKPHVVLMDLHLPGRSGTDLTAYITATHPTVAVLVLTMMEDDDSIRGALSAGAKGYLLKEATPQQIVRAVEAVASGQAVFGGSAAGRVIAGFAQRSRPIGPLPELTDREREVLDLVARGLTNTAIAERLYLNQKTVRNHVSNIFMKLNVSDRAAAVARARDEGLGTPGTSASRPDRSQGPL